MSERKVDPVVSRVQLRQESKFLEDLLVREIGMKKFDSGCDQSDPNLSKILPIFFLDLLRLRLEAAQHFLVVSRLLLVLLNFFLDKVGEISELA